MRRCHYRREIVLNWFRGRASAIAPVLLLSLSALTAPHIDALRDADSEILVPIAHDESAHRITTPAPDDDPGSHHCAVCHWSRAFRLHARGAVLMSSDAPMVRVATFDVISAISYGPAGRPPLRSPPVSSIA